MSSLFGRLLHRTNVSSQPTSTANPSAVLPTHWLDVTPRESNDRPCKIQSLQINVDVSGLYAQVCETLVLANPNKRPISAPISIIMPDRAVVCGYALEIDGQLIDGVVVPHEKARITFETERRRGADPGIIEATRGNVYRTEVYPIPAHGTRRIQLRYVTPLVPDGAQAAMLELPMPAEHLEHRSIQLRVRMPDAPRPQVSGLGVDLLSEADGCWQASAEEHDIVPADPVCLAMPQLPASLVMTERDNEGNVWFCASTEIPNQPTGEDSPTISLLTVLWDVSGSRDGQDHEQELALLSALGGAASVTRLMLLTFADRILETREFSKVGDLVSHLRGLRYDGGTNLVELSRAVAELPPTCTDIDRGGACLLFSDGLDTLSLEYFALPEGRDVLAVVSGAQRDTEALRQACHGLAFGLELAPTSVEQLAHVLMQGNPSRLLDVSGAGFAEVCDDSLAGSGRRSIVGRLTKPNATITMGDGRASFSLVAADAPTGEVLAKAWAARRVAQLSARASENERELLDLGRRFGVVSPATSMIVLETLGQWLEHDIEPPQSWKRMHDDWVQAKAGKMRLSSDEQERRQHLGSLTREWAELRSWWEHDYTKDVRREDGPEEQGAWLCPACGGALPPRAMYCPRCGSRVDQRRRTASSVGDSAPFAFAGRAGQNELEYMQAPVGASFSRSLQMLDSYAVSSMEVASLDMAADESADVEQDGKASNPQVCVPAWMPDTPYLNALDSALPDGTEACRAAYYQLRSEYHTSPSFFLDCAGWFLAQGDDDFGIRVLTNLAELRIEDAALLRVLGWRLREAGRLEQALVTLRRVLRLRSEDSQSYHDVALVLDELARQAYEAGNEKHASACTEEAGELYRTCALTPWQRRPMAIALFAVEEYNVLRAWAELQSWQHAPQLPSLGEDLEGVLACDLRITLAWDADETDVDLHVTEPTGEEAYYGHRRTFSGGRVSEDITDGYGPELYEIRRAQEGSYVIRAHYYASHQQTVFGPATCTLTVYTDWGRTAQAKQITSVRLDRAKEMVEVGVASYGDAAEAADTATLARGTAVTCGMNANDVVVVLGQPDTKDGDDSNALWTWNLPGDRKLTVQLVDGVVARVVESMPWGEDMIVSQ